MTRTFEFSDLQPAGLKQIEELFANYQKRNVEFRVLKRQGSRSALELINQNLKKAA